ncbi:PREDICTED: PDZ and LIM domain protein Zasp isoform X3 [Nicrophorus vespilloides]|uniref:PDZ and LIM domain protein Zasp isoform X3 n=1 Tax=Nicrophorus vespilloides TaxID=110193 RepID=A0ABM1MGW7_NICVS|nr:PREDICTED: PDZ and LIM domain protein Zasp isoform X3 [Nicrophorus vespilloides]
MAAQIMTIHLSKGESPNLGFRLQGGKDFAAPLVIQKVNGGSPADRAGLIAGDAVVKINNTDVFNLRHKDAQDVIIKAGPSFAITVQRGGSTWKPSVTPTGTFPAQTASINNVSPVTKTSLAAQPQPSIGAIGTGHNVAAKPFLNGTTNGAPKLVNKQYNTPVGLYSEESIAETLSAQSEVLSTGVLGVNFKKNEKGYDASKSAVYHMLQEAEKEPREPEPVNRSDFYSKHSHAIGGRNTTSRTTADRPSSIEHELTRCTDCERVIVGVFVRIKDKNLHVECFKCSTCGASLKNVGYYNINNKLYCDIHAKLAARSNPPGANLVPVTVPPGGRAPAGTISAALTSHSFPSPSPQSPKASPLSPSTNFTATPFQGVPNFSSAPKPFASVSAPLSPNSYSKPLPKAPVAPALIPAPQAPALTSTPEHETEIVCSNNMVEITSKTIECGDPTDVPFYNQINVTIPLMISPSISSNESYVSCKSSTLPKETDSISEPFTCSKNTYLETTFPVKTSGMANKQEANNNNNNINNNKAVVKNTDTCTDIPVCNVCNDAIIRGPFITALGKIWCPDHFTCATPSCKRPLQDIGFVEEKGQLHCEYCFEQYLAPNCSKCGIKIKGDCLKAIGRNFHPECFNCTHCGKLFANSPFFLEDGLPYCEADWNEMFTTKCFACGFPVEAGDRWVEALNNNYHSQCFNCTMCKKNLEGQSFFAKGGRPFCKNHAR